MPHAKDPKSDKPVGNTFKDVAQQGDEPEKQVARGLLPVLAAAGTFALTILIAGGTAYARSRGIKFGPK